MTDCDSWPRVSINDVCDSIIDCVNKTAPTVEGPTPFKMIRTTNVKRGWIDLTQVRYVTEEVYRKWTRRDVPRAGDVILTREAPLGEVGMVRTDDTIFLGQRLIQYRADPSKLDNRFLLYAFQADDVQAQIKSFGSGATVEHMRVPDCEQLTLRLPPFPMQRKIAAILSAYDDLIENNTRRTAILEEIARSLYREWFVHFRFPGHQNVPMVGVGDDRLPCGWEFSDLRQVTDYINRGISPTYDEVASGLVINQKCIRDGRFSLGPARRQSKTVTRDKLVRFGDVLINSTGVGTLGRVAQVYVQLSDCTVDSHVSIVRPSANIDLDYFGLSLLGLEAHFDRLGAGATGQTELARDRIAATTIVVPPRPLQDKFADLLGPMRHCVARLFRKNDVLRRTRDLLLPTLISGELDVSNSMSSSHDLDTL